MNQGEKEKTTMTALKKLLLMPAVVVACMFARVGPVDAVVVPGVTYPFTLTTVSIESGGTFQFDISASGTFYVDCGDGGTLSGTGVSGGTITKSNTTNNTYTCTYTGTAGAKVVQFGGTATGYNMDASPIVAAISFYVGGNDTNSRKIDSISGDLSAVFPYISSSVYPRFYRTFMYCYRLTSIPNTLFSSLTGSGMYMFSYTFNGCYGLTSIPYDLFYFGGNNVSGQQNMFGYTFNGCNSLTSIDGRLFSHITSSAQSLFNGVFGGCYGLTSIPYDLFYFGGNNVSGQQIMFSSAFYGCTGLTSIDGRLFSHVTSPGHYMFAYTFSGCTSLTSIPYDLFYFGGNDVSGSGFNQMFQGTFQGCTGLTSIDNRLFSKIISPEGNLFSGTFYGCTGLTALPTTLFSHFTTVKGWMFKETFYGCTNLSGYIPPSLFSGLITNGHPVDTDFMTDIFANTGLPTTCPSGTAPLTTGYEAFWSGKVACASPITYACGDGSGVAPSDMGAINGYQFKPAESTCTAPAGKTFSGWKVSGTSDIVDANVAFTWNYGTGKTLTAQYAPAYTVTYSCGDGVGTIQSTFAGAGAHFMPAANVCTAPSGKGFVGWAVSGTNDIVGAGTMFTWNYTENKTLTARWVNTPFTITTTNIETWEVFKFDLSAAGTFYVDCGKDGVLGSTDSTANAMITGGMIVKSDTKKYTYNCSYSTVGPKTIKFGGTATGYNMDTSPNVSAAISFYIDWNSANSRKIASISGDLSAVFPYISSSVYPRFYNTFAGCDTLTSIPNTLFSSLTGSGSYMFAYTFQNCTGLTSIPYDLFYFGGNNVAGADRMFQYTFYGCNHLTSIDGRLFKHVTTPASYLFSGTFSYCGGLTSLDSGLFSHFTSAATGMFNYAFAGDIGLTSIPYDLFYFGGNNIQGQQGLFAQTFQSCTGLTSIDGRLFSHITSSAPNLFNYTFSGCTGLTSIPYDLFYFGGNNVQGESAMFFGTFRDCTGLTSIDDRLFSHVTSSADGLFNQTFQNCTGLTALPMTLFSQFTDARSWMFKNTFNGCTNLSGYISPSLFSGLIANNHPTTTDFMTDIFVGTDLDTTCPTGTTQFTTGYESVWSGKVACGTTTVTYECGAGGGTAPAVMGASDGVQFTPAASTCTPPSGKTFFGWAVSGTNDVVAAGVPFTWNYKGNKTFTAQYVNAYNVTYSCGDVGGTIPSVIIGSGMSFTVAENTCNTTNAKAFKGWAISGTNTVVLPGDTFTWNYTGNKTLTAQWENTPFSVTTTSISSGGTFKFDLSASGTFYVDCGEGGTLGSADSTANAMISGKTITKSDTTKYTYVCTYTGTAGAKTIKFGGNATGYNMNISPITAAISLYVNSDYNNSRKITSIYGDLSAIFPYISSENYPRFSNTFANAILITSIPNTLFSSLTGTGQYMFNYTFSGCTELTSIPYDLFYFGGNNVSGQYYMFYGTFYRCSKLGSIDGRLFSHVTVPAQYLFNYTFYGCTGLTSIPYDLFHFGGNNVSGENGMFAGTFYGCTGLTGIDNRLFNHVTAPAQYLFDYTFYGCTGLTSIPYDLFYFGGNDVSGQNNMFTGTFRECSGLTSIDNRLFSKITSSAGTMFASTFDGCTGLTALPTTLFSQFSTATPYMFEYTFRGCTNLSGYIPPTLFSGLITNNHPTQNDFMTDIFIDTGLATTCPSGTGQFITGYESVWSGKVACGDSVTYECGAGGGNAPAVTGAVNGFQFAPAANTCTPPNGKTFLGWGVNGTNDVVNAGDTFTWNYTGNKIFTAQYVNAYNVTYSCGDVGGTIPSVIIGSGMSFTVAENTCNTPNGKAFKGWAVSGTNTIVDAGATFTWNYTESKTLTAQWENTPFSVTTTFISSGGTFKFDLSASGTFYVDCGEGGTLSGTGVNGKTITKSDTTKYTYVCTYTGTAGAKTIKFGGNATGYNMGTSTITAAISFYVSSEYNNSFKVASIYGDLSAIFPYISSDNYPRFYYSFYNTKITSIPNTLFSSLTGTGQYMFEFTFIYCSELTSIPYDLFYFGGNNVSGQYYMFYGTFYGCSKLGSIDGRLFSHVTVPAQYLFAYTFQGCTGLTSIPYDLFHFGGNNVSGQNGMFAGTFSGCTGLTGIDNRLFNHVTSSADSLFNYTFSGCTRLTSVPYDLFYFGGNDVSGASSLFSSTFNGCTGLTEIDGRLFSHVTSSANSLFRETFKNCTGLTSIPNTLFSGLSSSASYMFYSTFEGCTGLLTLPTSLFSQFSTAQTQMFQNTFKGCTGLGGYIPPSLFSGLIANNHPTTTNFMTDIFTDTGLATTCPTGTGQVITGYESVWSSKVACGDQITYACGDGTGDAPSAMGAVNGLPFTPAANTCTPPSGRAFSGWAVSDTNDTVNAGTKITWNYTGNKTLTAQYVTAYTVTYACGDGTGTEPTTAIMTNGASFTPAFNTCTAPNGKGFIGWAISGTNEVVGPGIAFTWEYTENKTLTAQWVNMPFTLTTTSIANGGTFTFNISAAGTFYVDCGDGGVLGSTDSTARAMISGNTITKTDNTTHYYFTCTYSGNAGAKTIKFGGTATGYSTNETTATMHFHQNTQVAAVSGDLSAIFPQLGTENGQIPRFYYMFRKCTNLTSITGDLFRGYTGGASNMFYATFEETKISSIPPNLFSNITTGASQLFRGTFYRCTNLTTIPPNLFSNVGGTSTAASMFLSTFAYCTGLTAVPDSLFSQFTTAANQMFNGTFSGCTNLSGYIKPTLFYGLIANGSPTATNFMKDIFANTGLDTTCPSDTGQFITGYESVWSSKVACSGDKIITYACGDGSGDAPEKMGAVNGLPFIPAVNTCNAPAGKVFSAWAVSDTNDSVKEGVRTAWNYSGNRTLTAQWKNAPFTLTTVSIESGGTFNFNLSASGTFYVDCGEGGTLGSTNSTANAMISGTKITKSNTTSYTYTCTYTGTAGPKTIQFAGTPNGYNTGTTVATISFNAGSDNAAKVASISGDLSAVFPYISSASGGYPRFYNTFSGCTELTEIPNTLFSGLTEAGTYMFYGTFNGCTGLTDIPYDLFYFGNNNVSGQSGLFGGTFNGCTGLTEIDNRLFSHVTSSAASMFISTFKDCTGLTRIPYDLFYFGNNNVSGQSSLFANTFNGCTGLTEIDNRLFSHVTSSAVSMFTSTFNGCTGLTGIPYDLFYFGNNEVSGQQQLFSSTFKDCTGLTEIDGRLFSHVTSSATNMFNSTFNGCTGLTGIPYNLFYFGNNEVSGQQQLFSSTFNGCTGLTEIDGRLFSHVTSSARSMFSSTFKDCTGLTGIPYNLFYFGDNEVSGATSLFSSTFNGCTGLTSIDNRLFSHVTSSATSLFSGTFSGCTGLTALPTTLFSHFTTAAAREFMNTFKGCTNLGGYVPPSLFAGLIDEHPTATSFMADIFTDTDLDQSCSGNMAQFTTGYESQWSSKVACGYTVTYSCGDGAGTPASSAIVGVGIPFTPAASTCSIPSGHTAFEGWTVSGTDDVKPAGTAFVWNYNSNKTLTARYTPNTVNMTFDGTTSMTCSLGGTFVPPTPEPRPGYVFTGWKVVTCAEKISRLDTDTGGNAVGFQNDSNGVYGAESLNTSDYGITTDNTWATEFDYGTVWGKAICNNTGSSIGAVATINPENSGAQCWCQVTGFTKSGNNYTTGPQCTLPASNSWTFCTGFSGVGDCAKNCADACATFVQGRPVFRAAIFGAVAQ